jgi:hypothetical protein
LQEVVTAALKVLPRLPRLLIGVSGENAMRRLHPRLDDAILHRDTLDRWSGATEGENDDT